MDLGRRILVVNPWLLLVLCLGAGGALLAQPGPLRFRGSTLLGFLLVTLGMTAPLPFCLTRMMLASSAGGDAFIGAWNLWWTRTAFVQGVNPLFCGWLFYPEGTNLALHTYNLTYGVLTLPVQWLLPLIMPGTQAGAGALDPLFVAYNLVILGSFTASGYFTYRLALLLTRHRTAAILAGLLFAYSNYRFANTVRLHVLGTEFLVLALWAWVAFWRHPQPRGLLGLVGSLVLLACNSIDYTACAVFFFLLTGIAEIAARGTGGSGNRRLGPGGERPVDSRLASDSTPRSWRSQPEPEHRKRDWLGAVFLSVVGGGLLLLPVGLGLLQRCREGGTGFDSRLAAFSSADLLDFLLPNPRHPLWGGLFQGATARLHGGDAGFGQSIGWVALGLFVIAVGANFRARTGRRWFWGFLVFLVLSLGPSLHLGGHALENPPLPQALVSKVLPFLASSRTPIRYLAPAGLCLALAVACGWAALRRRQGFADPSPARPGAARIEVVVGVALLFESLAAPVPLLRVPVPEVYAQIPPTPGFYALAVIPGLTAPESMLYQVVHGQRLVQSVEAAIPLHSPRSSSPFDGAHWEALMRNLGTPGWIASQPDENRAQVIDSLRRMFSDAKVRWVVLQRTRPVLARDGRSFGTESICDEAAFNAFRENLRKLWPTLERDIGGDALFMFETTEIQD
jgi:hypothetical protein